MTLSSRLRNVRVVVDAMMQDLAGTWRGSGAGSYPTIEDFRYTEELVITPVPGRPLAHWRSRTADAGSGEPRHSEAGFLRLSGARWELVLAHSFGVTEVSSGDARSGEIDVVSAELAGVGGAKRIDGVRRSYRFDGDRLTYRIAMAAVGVPMTHHLAAELRR